MKKILAGTIVALLTTLSLSLAGCGSSSSSGVSTVGGSSRVSGVAAAGSALVGTAYLKDSSTPAKELSIPLNNDGSFTFDVTGMQGPFIMQAVGTVGTSTYTMYSLAVGPGTANINPLSSVAVAGAAGGTDPALDFASPSKARSQSMAANLPAAVATLGSSLKPLYSQYGVTIDPITGPFVANHTGLDALFDAVTIGFSAGMITVMNTGTKAVIFSCQANNISGGTFMMANMPLAPTPTPTPGPTPGPTPMVPAAPSGVTALGASRQVTLSWSAVNGATSYNIYFATATGVTTTGTKIASASSPYVQTGLLDSTSYYYVVTAVNGAGESAVSVQASAITTAPAFNALAYYNSVCLGCHGTLGVRTSAQITSAIASFGAMKSLSTLTAVQIAAIAAVSH